MEAIACVEHGDAVALTRNGELTVVLFAGVETVTLSKAGAAHTASAGVRKQRVFMQVGPYCFFKARVRLARSVLARSLSGAHSDLRVIDGGMRHRSLSKIYSIRNLRN